MEGKPLVHGWSWGAALVMTLLTIGQVASGWLTCHLWQKFPKASQRLECNNLNGEEQGRHLWSFKEPACRRVIRPHDYLHVILPRGAVDLVLMIGEGWGSSELALLEAVLKEHGKSSGQEVLGYDGHL